MKSRARCRWSSTTTRRRRRTRSRRAAAPLKISSVGFALWLLPLAGARRVARLGEPARAGVPLLHAGRARHLRRRLRRARLRHAGAASSYGWLTQAQAVDGLALAETTPGPLIMVLQFVGFMAGLEQPAGHEPSASAVVGALVTTYTTFLPCFLFIFLGAPYIEVLRGNKNLTGALTGVTAAVVGVILNLALVFGAAVIWPGGFAGNINWFAPVMSVLPSSRSTSSRSTCCGSSSPEASWASVGPCSRRVRRKEADRVGGASRCNSGFPNRRDFTRSSFFAPSCGRSNPSPPSTGTEESACRTPSRTSCWLCC